MSNRNISGVLALSDCKRSGPVHPWNFHSAAAAAAGRTETPTRWGGRSGD